MKKVKNFVKKIPILYKLLDRLRFSFEYHYDKKFFLSNYSHSKITKNKLGYNILLATHSLEKGMSNTKLRYFAIEKTKQIVEMLKEYSKFSNYENDYAFINGINALRSYTKIYEDNKWFNREEYTFVKSFLEDYKNIQKMNVGSFVLKKSDFIESSKIDYLNFLSSRHSVRNFENKKLKEKDIEKAIKMAIKTPTACNRQMVKIYLVNNDEKREKLLKIGQGFGGFEFSGINIFVITFDVNANYFVGERNQGWFNAGLVSMNFVNALHSLGIGSCFIQFGNSTKEEELVKKQLNIPSSERIAVFIAAGYYADESKIPYSPRKTINDIYNEIK